MCICYGADSERITQVVVGVRGKPLGASPMLVLPVGDALQEPFWCASLPLARLPPKRA